MHGYNGYGFGGMGYGMGFGWIIWIVVLVLIIFLLVKISGSQNNSSTGREKSRALEILKERYAKGEIDKQEFEEKKKNLK